MVTLDGSHLVQLVLKDDVARFGIARVIAAGLGIEDLDAAGVDAQLTPGGVLVFLLDADIEVAEVFQAAVEP